MAKTKKRKTRKRSAWCETKRSGPYFTDRGESLIQDDRMLSRVDVPSSSGAKNNIKASSRPETCGSAEDDIADPIAPFFTCDTFESDPGPEDGAKDSIIDQLMIHCLTEAMDWFYRYLPSATFGQLANRCTTNEATERVKASIAEVVQTSMRFIGCDLSALAGLDDDSDNEQGLGGEVVTRKRRRLDRCGARPPRRVASSSKTKSKSIVRGSASPTRQPRLRKDDMEDNGIHAERNASVLNVFLPMDHLRSEDSPSRKSLPIVAALFERPKTSRLTETSDDDSTGWRCLMKEYGHNSTMNDDDGDDDGAYFTYPKASDRREDPDTNIHSPIAESHSPAPDSSSPMQLSPRLSPILSSSQQRSVSSTDHSSGRMSSRSPAPAEAIIDSKHAGTLGETFVAFRLAKRSWTSTNDRLNNSAFSIVGTQGPSNAIRPSPSTHRLPTEKRVPNLKEKAVEMCVATVDDCANETRQPSVTIDAEHNIESSPFSEREISLAKPQRKKDIVDSDSEDELATLPGRKLCEFNAFAVRTRA